MSFNRGREGERGREGGREGEREREGVRESERGRGKRTETETKKQRQRNRKTRGQRERESVCGCVLAIHHGNCDYFLVPRRRRSRAREAVVERGSPPRGHTKPTPLEKLHKY